MSKKTFMRGAVILSVAGIIVKILGACFRIPLGNLIGADGMGYYQTVYPVYNLLLTVATAGIPVAISRMVSERISEGNYWGANRVFKVTLYLMIILGAILFAISYVLADSIIGLVAGMDDAVYALRAIAPALLFVPIMASFRGYFQGMQNMRPTAISQIFEQFFRVLVGLALAFYLVKKGEAIAAAGATFGATAGSFIGLVIIFLIYLLLKSTSSHKKKMHDTHEEFASQKESVSRIVKQIFIIAIPITLGAAIMPIMSYIDSVLVINRLVGSGWGVDESRAMYGQLTGFANSLVSMPNVITQAIAISIVPTIATAFTLKDNDFVHRNVKLGVRTAIIMGLPCTVGMLVLAEPIMLLLYPTQKADAVMASQALIVLSFTVVFLAMDQTLTSILQGVGKQNIPVYTLLIGAFAKFLCTYYLTAIPAFNVKGAAFGTVAAYLIAAILNLVAVKKYTHTKFDIGVTYIRPLISVIIMGGIAYAVHFLLEIVLGNSIATLLAIMVAAISYVVLLFATGSIKESELSEFPKGDKLTIIYRKVMRKSSPEIDDNEDESDE